MAMTEQRLFEAAVRYLQRYAASSEHLRRVLKRKLKRAETYGPVPPEAVQWIDTAVRRCADYGYIDDKAYAESRVRSLRRQGRSTHYIQRYLQEKGVPQDISAAFLASDENTELASAVRHVQRRRLGRATGPEARQKDLARLVRAGFSLAVARRALDQAQNGPAQQGDDDPV